MDSWHGTTTKVKSDTEHNDNQFLSPIIACSCRNISVISFVTNVLSISSYVVEEFPGRSQTDTDVHVNDDAAAASPTPSHKMAIGLRNVRALRSQISDQLSLYGRSVDAVRELVARAFGGLSRLARQRDAIYCAFILAKPSCILDSDEKIHRTSRLHWRCNLIRKSSQSCRTTTCQFMP